MISIFYYIDNKRYSVTFHQAEVTLAHLKKELELTNHRVFLAVLGTDGLITKHLLRLDTDLFRLVLI